jgi:hypothetical protein
MRAVEKGWLVMHESGIFVASRKPVRISSRDDATPKQAAANPA